MSYTVAVAGKGGVGKSTVSTLLIKYLIKKDPPVLAVDADPNSNLNTLLGLGYEETIADIREQARSSSSLSMPKSDLFNMRLQEIITEGDGVDLLVMGRPEGSGCYCAVNNILRDYLSKLSKNYKYVVIDNEAGMEHLSRRTAGSIDKLLLVSDSTMTSILSAINAFNTAKKTAIEIKGVSLLINRAKDKIDNEKISLLKTAGLTITGYIPFIDKIKEMSETGAPVPEAEIEVFEELLKKP